MTTEQYPFEPKVTKPRYHGRHVLNRHPDGLEKCVGCELCAWACPADAIYVEGGDNTEEARFSPGERYGAVYQINYLRCIFCGLCIEACPTRSLTMSNDFELADDNRQDLIYTKEQLMAPLLPGMEQPPHPMRLGDDEKDYYLRVPGSSPGRAGRGGAGMTVLAAVDTSVRLGGGETVVFWVLGPIALAGALGMVLSRNAVHSALWLVNTMLAFGVFYVVQEAPFLGAVQIIVYTGAIMILFLFVLMLVGRDSSDSVVETLRGQRVAAIVLGVGFAGLVGAGIARATQDLPVDRARGGAGRTGQHPGDRRAAVHQVPARLRGHQRAADHRRGGRHGARAHRARARQPAHPEGALAGPVPHRPAGTLPGPGVFARANSVAVPAILPDGRAAEDSLATGLEPQEPDQMARPTGREQLGSPDAALGTLDPAPLDGDGAR